MLSEEKSMPILIIHKKKGVLYSDDWYINNTDELVLVDKNIIIPGDSILRISEY